MLNFDNLFVNTLSGDHSWQTQSRTVLNASYSLVKPTPVATPVLCATSNFAAQLLDLSDNDLKQPEFLSLLAGNLLTNSMLPFSTCYGGYQFGHWAGQLGDGRAICLGDLLNKNRERWELQLKGAGPTPYSRSGDGRAVLRSSIREFICSEAMHCLGVPTTRAMSLITTGEKIVRDMFYNGNPTLEPGAIISRLAPSFVRFGNFEIFAARKDEHNLKALADFIIRHHFSELADDLTTISQEIYRRWFALICQRTADLIVHWLRIGFVHGVMNTDNMSILGLTIDYGPFGWLDIFDPNFTPNTSDQYGRYRFNNQAAISQWNLAALGSALMPLLGHDFDLHLSMENYLEEFNHKYVQMFMHKLGLKYTIKTAEEDRQLITMLLHVFKNQKFDMTIFFRALQKITICENPDFSHCLNILQPSIYDQSYSATSKQLLQQWLQRYIARSMQDNSQLMARCAIMQATNPCIIPRNYLIQHCIEAAEQGDNTKLQELLQAVQNPYQENPAWEKYMQKRPAWAHQAPGCGALSCSS